MAGARTQGPTTLSGHPVRTKISSSFGVRKEHILVRTPKNGLVLGRNENALLYGWGGQTGWSGAPARALAPALRTRASSRGAGPGHSLRPPRR